MKTRSPLRIGSWLGVGALLDWLELVPELDWLELVPELDWLELVLELDWLELVPELDWLELVPELEVVRLEELVVLKFVDALLEEVTAVELGIVVFVEPSEIVDEIVEDDTVDDDIVDVRTTEEVDCVIVLLLDRVALLLADDVPLKLPDVVGTTELLGKVEVGDVMVVPLVTNTDEDEDEDEDEETGADEVFEVAGAVGPNDEVLLVALPYGGSIGIVLGEILLEDPVAWEVEFTSALLLEEIPLEVELWVVRGAVGPRVIVLFPYGDPLVETLEEKPVDGRIEVRLAGTVLLMDPTALVEDGEVPVVRGAVGSRGSELLVPLPYGAPLVLLLEENPLEATVAVLFAALEVGRTVLLALRTIEDETPVVRGPVGPRGSELLVPLLYGAPLVLRLEENPLEATVVELFAALEVGRVVLLALWMTEDEAPVERGTVGPRETVLLVPLPYGPPVGTTLEEKPVEAALEVELTTLVTTAWVLLEDVLTLEVELTMEKVVNGPREIVLLVPLPYSTPLVGTLEEKPVEATLEVELTTERVLFGVETGTVGPREMVLLVPFP
jgi:hypothetical protein